MVLVYNAVLCPFGECLGRMARSAQADLALPSSGCRRHGEESFLGQVDVGELPWPTTEGNWHADGLVGGITRSYNPKS